MSAAEIPRYAALLLSIVLVGCDGSSTTRSDVPLASPAHAKLADPILPAKASAIYYLNHAGGLQDLERFVRFRVPILDIEKTVADLIFTNDAQFHRSLSYAKASLSSTPPVLPRTEFQPVKWWTPSAIISGYYRGETDSYALQIWVDSERGDIYLYQND